MSHDTIWINDCNNYQYVDRAQLIKIFGSGFEDGDIDIIDIGDSIQYIWGWES